MVAVIFFSWIITGIVVGFIASKCVNLRGDDPKLGIGAAAAGALLSGFIYTFASGAGMQAFTGWGVFYTAVGALVAVAIWHAVRSRTISHETQTARRSY